MSSTREAINTLLNRVEAARHRIDRDGRLDPRFLEGLVSPGIDDVFTANLSEIHNRHRQTISDGKRNNAIHYTGIATVTAMLNHHTNELPSFLRMYDSLNLNDPEEGQLFYRHFSLPEEYKWMCDRNPPHAYIASFIIPNDPDKPDEPARDDNLKYWLAYGKGGDGCSLRIKLPQNRLHKVLYGSDSVKETIQQLDVVSILRTLDPLIDVPDPLIQEQVRAKLSETVWQNTARIAYLYKDSAYNYEKECRLVEPARYIPDGVNFQFIEHLDGYGQLRHYYEDDTLRTNEILVTGSSVTLGPCVPRRSIVKFSLERLFRKANLTGPEVKCSKIPFRKR